MHACKQVFFQLNVSFFSQNKIREKEKTKK
jgi:hypothetical protein